MIAEIVQMYPGCKEGGEHLLIIPCRLGPSRLLGRSICFIAWMILVCDCVPTALAYAIIRRKAFNAIFL
jgi:hypothetical protein